VSERLEQWFKTVASSVHSVFQTETRDQDDWTPLKLWQTILLPTYCQAAQMDRGIISVKAYVRLLPSDQPGRVGLIRSGHHLNHNFGGPANRTLYVGQITFPEDRWYSPGSESEVRVDFVDFPGLRECLVPGREWHIQEAARVVAEAKVLEVIPTP
jgi:hypothetical protein